MAPHEGRKQMLNYLKREYCWKQSFIYKYTNESGKTLTHEFNWTQVNKARAWAENINPENYKILMYLTKTERTRQAIADAMFLDMTTIKRRADKCLDQLMHYLIGVYVNLEDYDELIQPIDLRSKIGY
jgi:hypothetical protein